MLLSNPFLISKSMELVLDNDTYFILIYRGFFGASGVTGTELIIFPRFNPDPLSGKRGSGKRF
jgi:hypothetical protein